LIAGCAAPTLGSMTAVAGRRRDILLLGSVGLANAEEVFRTVAGTIGERAPRIPDGETGYARSVWVQCQRPFFLGNPALEMVEPDPDKPAAYRAARVPSAGIYGHTRAESYLGQARLRPGVAASDVRFDNLGYADWAIESYAVFSRLKLQGVVPRPTRFQVSIPAPSLLVSRHVLPEAQAVVGPVYTAALFREVERMAVAIPIDELAIQWDSTHPPAYDDASSEARATILQHLASLSHHVPEGVELGYHLCYGDFEHRHGVQPKDLQTCVDIANQLVQTAGRDVNWVHMPVPRDRSDAAYFAPLRELRLPPATRLYLGLIHYTDGLQGTQKRLETAAATYADFGLATECGLGRRVGQDIPELLRLHAAAADLQVEVPA
jgi:hypothetical protein